MTRPVNKKHIILGVTGSIAAYKSADIIRRLQDKGLSVSVIMTQEAEEFICPLTLATLSGEKVHRKMFDQEQVDWQMEHLSLAQKADAILIAPATANIIGKIANGITDDLLSCTVMATRAPVVFAPAMNSEMFKNSIMQNNIRKLKKYKYIFVNPIKGKLACGTIGCGHLAEVGDIIKRTIAALR